MTEKGYFNLVEAGAYLGLAPETIKAAIHSVPPRIKAKKSGKNGGGIHLIAKAELDSFFEKLADA